MIHYYRNIARNFLTLVPYIAEYNLLNAYSTLKGHPLRDQKKHKRLKPQMIKYIEKGLAEDAELCAEINYKHNEINFSSLRNHIESLINVYRDYPQILKARGENIIKTGSSQVYPDYYNRCFHFQTDGYTSEYSAKLYDHQVDILFAGMAGPMRRTILEEFRNFRPSNVLEIGCGTGSATELVAKHLTSSDIQATDMSHEYISYAQKNRSLKNVNYSQKDALDVEGEYDCIFHVFLLHELPSKVRQEILEKQLSALSPTGKGIIVESLQVGDIEFLNEVLFDFPRYYHEPFYKHYIENPVEEQLRKLGAKNIKTTKRLFSKCVSFSK